MTPPRVLNSIDPSSNEYAQQYGIAGMELLRTVVDATGVPRQMAIARPIGFGLDEKAVDAIKNSRFHPATLNGQPVPVVVDLAVTSASTPMDQTRFGEQGIEGDSSGRCRGGNGRPMLDTDANLSVSQRFFNLIRTGQTAEVAAAAEEDPSLIACRDAQGVSAFLWSIYHGQPLIRDFLLGIYPVWISSRPPRWGIAAASNRCCDRMRCVVHESSAHGWAPLHLAAAFGGPEATALLSLTEHSAPLFTEPYAQPAIACLYCTGPQLRNVAAVDRAGCRRKHDAGRRVHTAAPSGGGRTRRCDPDPARSGEQTRRASAIRARPG